MGGGMEKARTCCRIVVAAVLVVALYLSWLGCSIAAANADRITELERGGILPRRAPRLHVLSSYSAGGKSRLASLRMRRA